MSLLTKTKKPINSTPLSSSEPIQSIPTLPTYVKTKPSNVAKALCLKLYARIRDILTSGSYLYGKNLVAFQNLQRSKLKINTKFHVNIKQSIY